ncbi:MAG: DNA mismatch repair endonuclease MutL [Anaerolineae bacterium]
MPPRISLLDDVTISRIAAGEVVERPASVVKELVENSIDAHAGDVRVEIQDGGARLIRVADDGHGIPPDEVRLALERHATSKIATAADLVEVASLGFRGEALASIAAVSIVTLESRAAHHDSGTRLRVENGRAGECTSIGMGAGTTVTVEHLFEALPARRAFLRRAATEAGHVHEVVARYALAYPERRFKLVRDGRTTLEAPGSGSLADAVLSVLGLEPARQMIPIEHAQGDIEVGGYVSPPHLHRATRKDIALFVNGRWVQDRQLSFAVTQAYHTLLPKGRFPIAIVQIRMPPALVDVNVHPAKTEVRFRDGRPVFAAVQRAVRAAASGQAPVPSVGPQHQSGTAGADRWTGAPGGTWGGAPQSRFAERLAAAQGTAEGQATFTPAVVSGLPPLRVLGQIARCYIAAEGPDGLYLIDQHAAHERVMYEELMARGDDVASQRLLEPVAVELSASQMAVVEEHRATFAALGFDTEPFGADTVLVRSLPDVLLGGDVAESLRTIADLTAVGEAPIADAVEERLVRAVCKQATVKAGQSLSEQEMRELVRRLESTSSPRTCPHGRPTVIALSLADLEREFGRI